MAHLHAVLAAKVKEWRKGGFVNEDFPAISELLEHQLQHIGVTRTKSDQYRSMIDCLMIDTSFDGNVFDICLSDIPSKKTDLIDATYELAAPDRNTTVAVKIIDMLGEEVLFLKEVD